MLLYCVYRIHIYVLRIEEKLFVYILIDYRTTLLSLQTVAFLSGLGSGGKFMSRGHIKVQLFLAPSFKPPGP